MPLVGSLTFCSEGAEKTAGQREATMGPEDLRELCWGLVLSLSFSVSCHEIERWLSAACVQAHTSSLTPPRPKDEAESGLGARLEGNSLLWRLPAPHGVAYVERHNNSRKALLSFLCSRLVFQGPSSWDPLPSRASSSSDRVA